MSILIKDMEMPKVEDEFVEVVIYGDGKVIQTGKSWRCKEDGKCYYESITPELFYHAIEIPKPHGRLGDLDALKVSLAFAKETAKWSVPLLRTVLMIVDKMPTIIPASEEGE